MKALLINFASQSIEAIDIGSAAASDIEDVRSRIRYL